MLLCRPVCGDAMLRAGQETDTEILETIKERSAGYVKALEYLTGFESSGKKVYMFIKQMEE